MGKIERAIFNYKLYIENVWWITITIIMVHNLNERIDLVAQFDQSGLSFTERSYYLDPEMSPKVFKAFHDYFTSVNVLLGTDMTTSRRLSQNIWELEKKIATVSISLSTVLPGGGKVGEEN